MSESLDLRELANRAIENTYTAVPQEAKLDEEYLTSRPVEIGNIDEEDSIIISPIAPKENESVKPVVQPVKIDLTEEEAASPIQYVSTEGILGFSDQDLRDMMPDLTDEKFAEILPGLKENILKYRKNLIINSGFTDEEADEAARNKIKKDSAEENTKYLEENPNVGVIRINKTDLESGDIGLTEEEHEKLQKVKVIKLSVVEDAELKTIKIDKKFDAKHKSDYVKSIEGALSKYSVPLPVFGDFVTFRGAQIIQLASTVMNEDDRLEEIINKKASLIYDKLNNGKIIRKFDEKGNIKMTYEEFINKFPYQDLDIALYAILVASSMEETEVTLSCPHCNEEFNHTYNVKTLLNMDDASDEFKSRIDRILGDKTNTKVLQELHDDMDKAVRYKSPFTNNIYQVSYPTVGRAVSIFEKINQTDQVMVYNSLLALYLNAIYLYNPATDEYIPITEEEVDLLLDTILDICDEDYQLIINQVKDTYIYNPKFILKAKCPHCNKDVDLTLNVENLVFLKAQDSTKEIE